MNKMPTLVNPCHFHKSCILLCFALINENSILVIAKFTRIFHNEPIFEHIMVPTIQSDFHLVFVSIIPVLSQQSKSDICRIDQLMSSLIPNPVISMINYLARER